LDFQPDVKMQSFADVITAMYSSHAETSYYFKSVNYYFEPVPKYKASDIQTPDTQDFKLPKPPPLYP